MSFDGTKCAGRLARWHLIIQYFNQITRKANTVADTFSRCSSRCSFLGSKHFARKALNNSALTSIVDLVTVLPYLFYLYPFMPFLKRCYFFALWSPLREMLLTLSTLVLTFKDIILQPLYNILQKGHPGALQPALNTNSLCDWIIFDMFTNS